MRMRMSAVSGRRPPVPCINRYVIRYDAAAARAGAARYAQRAM
eukprot:SAG31_NODE_21073_length_558_cov_1.122004_1_plen_42_part_10